MVGAVEQSRRSRESDLRCIVRCELWGSSFGFVSKHRCFEMLLTQAATGIPRRECGVEFRLEHQFKHVGLKKNKKQKANTNLVPLCLYSNSFSLRNPDDHSYIMYVKFLLGTTLSWVSHGFSWSHSLPSGSCTMTDCIVFSLNCMLSQPKQTFYEMYNYENFKVLNRCWARRPRCKCHLSNNSDL